MKKHASILTILFIAAFVLLGSVGVSAAAEHPQIVSFDTERYSLTAIDAVAEKYDLTYILDGFYTGNDDAVKALENHPMVLSVEPAGIAVLCDDSGNPLANSPVKVSSTVYNDPYAAGQWALGVINIEKCWQYYTRGSKDVVVCVIDSGFYYGHEDALENFVEGKDYVEDFEVNIGIDDTSHGTSVAGIIGATSDNGIGITGLLKDVTIVNHKAFYWDEEQKKKIATADDIALAIRDSVDEYNADVINMSFLFDTDEAVIREACEYAVSQGVILVAAAGNNGSEGSALQYPAAYDCVIGVGAVDANKNVVSFSARNESVFCCAPGVNICSLRNPDSKEDNIDALYRRDAGGTSLATPHVVGLAAMALSYHPDLDVDTFKELLKNSCTDLGEKGYDTVSGYGLVNYEKMMRLLDGNVFDDVPKEEWFHDAVVDVYRNGLMIGTEKNLFGPQTKLTRGMFVTILHRMDGEPASTAEVPFTDLPADMYYNEAIAWAYENEVAMGMSDTRFAPDTPINREQVVTMLYRYYNDYKKAVIADNGGVVDFRDADKISDWAETAVITMVKAGVLTGFEYEDENGTYYMFKPQNTATRAESAKIISGLE